MVQVAEQPTQHPGPVEEPSLVSAPPTPQNEQLSKSVGVWIRVIHPSKECAVARIQTGPLNVVLLSWWWEEPGTITYPFP